MAKGNPWCRVVKGKVVTQNKWSETRISSSGGGGYLMNGYGQINPTTIKSSVTDRNEMFVQDQNGGEHVFHNLNITVRDGTNVLIILASERGEELGDFIYTENMDTHEVRRTGIKISPGYGLFNGSFVAIVVSIIYLFAILLGYNNLQILSKIQADKLANMIGYVFLLSWTFFLILFSAKHKVEKNLRISKFIKLVKDSALTTGVALKASSKSPVLFDRE